MSATTEVFQDLSSTFMTPAPFVMLGDRQCVLSHDLLCELVRAVGPRGGLSKAAKDQRLLESKSSIEKISPWFKSRDRNCSRSSMPSYQPRHGNPALLVPRLTKALIRGFISYAFENWLIFCVFQIKIVFCVVFLFLTLILLWPSEKKHPYHLDVALLKCDCSRVE
jgi:hypothetical protein